MGNFCIGMLKVGMVVDFELKCILLVCVGDF